MTSTEQLTEFDDSKPVLKGGGSTLCFRDVVESLRTVGVERGDVVMVHSSLFQLGRPIDLKNKNAVPDAFVEAFLRILGSEGTLIVPTFTYSFCRGEPFDVQNSPTRMGILPERVRRLPEALRSVQPIFSAAALGGQASELLKDVGTSSFGEDSLFDRIHRLGKAKYMCIGADLWVLTAIHHVEQTFGVSYRLLKEFSGEIIESGRRFAATFDYYVRGLDVKAKSCFHEAYANHLRSTDLLSEVPLGTGSISMIREADLFSDATGQLEQNNQYFVTDMDRNPIGLEGTPETVRG